MAKRKTYDELTFADDFMFGEVLRKHPEICRELAELVTGRKIISIRPPEVQKTEKFLYEGKGVRFDVTFEDETRTVYDIEMQTVLKETLNKRSRYYSSMLDMDHLRRGAKYYELPDTYIVFICLDDPFHEDIVRYTFRETCEERPALKLGDGRSIIFINTKSANGASPQLREFSEYLHGRRPASDFTKAIDKAVSDQKDDEAGRRKFMTLEEHYEIERAEGREEGMAAGLEKGRTEGLEKGRAEGIDEGRAQMVKNSLKYGNTIEQTALFLGLSQEEVTRLSKLQ